MRGEVSYIAHRYRKANNKYMKDHDPNKESKHIMYLDANNLYGWAMSQSLPTAGFRWLNTDKEIDLDKYDENSDKGLVLEVDLEYPEELHDSHNGYPMAPERLRVSRDMQSNVQCKFFIAWKFT
jgi:hypothetical protein